MRAVLSTHSINVACLSTNKIRKEIFNDNGCLLYGRKYDVTLNIIYAPSISLLWVPVYWLGRGPLGFCLRFRSEDLSHTDMCRVDRGEYSEENLQKKMNF